MKNLLIVFPGGGGGNHLANLISLNDKFTPLFPSSNYVADLISKYNIIKNYNIAGPGKNSWLGSREVHGVKMHFTTDEDLNQLKTPEKFNNLLKNETINILLGHDHCYYEVECQQYGQLVSKLPDKFWLVMSFPKENTLAYNRIKLYEFTPNPERYNYPFYTCDYKDESYANADYSNGLPIETEKFIDVGGCEYLREKLKIVDIELPAVADELHSIWINKIKEVLDIYDYMPK